MIGGWPQLMKSPASPGFSFLGSRLRENDGVGYFSNRITLPLQSTFTVSFAANLPSRMALANGFSICA